MYLIKIMRWNTTIATPNLEPPLREEVMNPALSPKAMTEMCETSKCGFGESWSHGRRSRRSVRWWEYAGVAGYQPRIDSPQSK